MRDAAAPAIPAGVPDERIWHVAPVNDWREHDTDSRGACWCKPEIEAEGMGFVVTHRAARSGDCKCSTH